MTDNETKGVYRMHFFTRRTGRGLARLAVFCLVLLGLSGAGASASSQGEEDRAIRSAIESYLRAYEDRAMLYQERDLLSGTVADPSLSLPQGSGEAVFRFGKKEVKLDKLRENMLYLAKKADFYAGMRQMQNIYRENLRLTFALEELERWENACSASVRETAEFQYTDSDRPSVYETGFSVRLVKLGERWLVADVSNGSQFDKTYKSAAFDPEAALAEFAACLEREDCAIAFTGGASGGGQQIAYSGQDAAAYAYTYSRRSGNADRNDFYNPRFFSYAGEGGDCQNFVSQCIWAGFGGSEDSSSIHSRALPMDASGSSQWFGRPSSGGKYSNSWLSCQSFRQYLTGTRDASGRGGSNAAGDAGMYAAVLSVGRGGAVSAVTPEELVGAAAHVEGSGGLYAHAILFTAATGTSRSQIWFCGHTRDVTHVKLGDCYIGPIKVYIPRYIRTGGQAQPLRAERAQPVKAGETGVLAARAGSVQSRMRITVTAPDGAAEQIVFLEHADNCWGEYLFPRPGLYRVDCRAEGAGGTSTATYYVRCYEPESDGPGAADAPPEDGGGGSEIPGWLLPPEDGSEEPDPSGTEPPENEQEDPGDSEIPGWLLS